MIKRDRIRMELHVPSWSCPQAVWHIPLLYVQWKTADDGQRNCPKHVEFYYKNKFEKLVHLVSSIIRMYHDARSPERQTIYHDARSPIRQTIYYDARSPERQTIYHDARSPERQTIYHDARSPERQSRKWPFMYNLHGRQSYTILFVCRAAG